MEKIGLIKVHNDRGTRRYLLRDPRLAIQRLYELNEIDLDELEDANDLLEKIRQPLIESKTAPKKPVVAMLLKKSAQANG